MDGREYCIVSDGREYCCFCLFLMAENPVLLLLMAKNTVLLFLFVSDGREYIVVFDGREYCIVVSVCFWWQRILYCCFCLFLMAENTVLLFLFVFDGREYWLLFLFVSDCSFVPMDRTVKMRHTSDQQPSLYKASHSSLTVSFISCHNSHPSMYQPCMS